MIWEKAARLFDLLLPGEAESFYADFRVYFFTGENSGLKKLL
jgi:hypothetical protein